MISLFKQFNKQNLKHYTYTYFLVAFILIAVKILSITGIIQTYDGLLTVSCIVLLPFSAISFLIYLLHSDCFQHNFDFIKLAFSCAYSLSSFAFANSGSVAAVFLYIFLPILLLTFEQFIRKKSFLPLSILFALILCLDTVTGCILFIYLFLLFLCLSSQTLGTKIADSLHLLVLFAFALLLSAAFSFPQLSDFFTQTAQNSYNGFFHYYPMSNLFSRFLPGSVLSHAFSSGYGIDFYFGLLPFYGFILYFFHNGIALRKRIRVFVFTLFVFLSLELSPIQFLIELCRTTNVSYIYYAFFFVFFGLILSFKTITTISNYKKSNLILGLVTAVLFTILGLAGSAHNFSVVALVFLLLLVPASLVLLYSAHHTEKQLIPRFAIPALIFAELIFHAIVSNQSVLTPSTISLEDRYVWNTLLQADNEVSKNTEPPYYQDYQDFYQSSNMNYLYTTMQAVNTYVELTPEETDKYNPNGLLNYFDEFNIKCHKLGINSDVLQRTDAEFAFASSDLYEIVDQTNNIYNFHPFQSAYAYNQIIIPYTVTSASDQSLIIYNNINGSLNSIIPSDTTVGYLSFVPSEDISLNFQLYAYIIDEKTFNSIPLLLRNYMQANASVFSSVQYLIYFALTCISILILLLLTLNKHKSSMIDLLFSLKKRISDMSVFSLISRFAKDNYVYLASFFVPFFLFILSMIVFSSEPFGSNSFLDGDGYPSVLAGILGYYHNLKNGTYILNMLSGFSSNMFSASSIFYTLPLLPFSVSAIPSVLLLSEAILFGLCGFSMTYYLTHRLNGRKAFKRDFRLLIPAFIYSLNTFMLTMHSYAYSWYLLFFILPLLILNLERLLYCKKWFPYTLLLAFCIFTNINIALYLCIFLVIYFFTCHFTDWKDFIKKGIRFASCSLLGALCALCNIITIFTGLTNSGYSDKDSIFPTPGFHGSFLDQWSRLMPFSPSEAVDTNPGGISLYMSLLCLILLFVYICSKSVSWREKAARLIPSCILLLSFNGQVLSYLWNGMHYQSNVPNRYVFLLMFLCSVMAYDALSAIRRISLSKLTAMSVTLIGFLSLCQFAGEKNTPLAYVSSIIGILLYLTVHIFFSKRKSFKKIYYPVIIVLLLTELTTNWFYCCKNFGLSAPIAYANYEKQGLVNQALLDNINTFSRINTPATVCINVGCFTGNPNSNIFTSTLTTNQQTLNSIYGNCGGDNFIFSNYDSTPWGQSCAANSYIEIPIYSTLALRDLSHYQYVGTTSTYYIFKNPDALHLGFYVPYSITDMNESISLPDFTNFYTNLYTDTTDKILSNPIILPATSGKETSSNCLTFLDSSFNPISRQDADAILHSKVTDSSMVSSNQNLYIRLNFTPDNSGQVYLYLNEFISLGYFEAGEKATVTIPYPNKTKDLMNEYLCYTFNDEVYQAFIDNVSKNQLENINIDDNIITAETNYEKDGYTMLSLPYDENWHAYIDGKEVVVENPINSAIFVPTPAGKHTFKLVYDVTPLIVSTWISIGTTSFTCLLYLVQRILLRKKGRD